MMNCKDILRIVNPPIWSLYPQIVYANNKLYRSFQSIEIESDMRMLAINMIMDGAY